MRHTNWRAVSVITRHLDIKPSIGSMAAPDVESEVIGRDRWSSTWMFAFIGAEGEDAKSTADLGAAKGDGFGFAEGAQFAGAALRDAAGDFVGKSGGFGAGAFGKGEDVEVGEGQALDEG